MNLGELTTEARNPRSADLDVMDTRQMLELMNDEDRTVAVAVRDALPEITEAVDLIAASLRSGGRLIYVGAGTSGRLGLLDAVECPPTFDTDADQVTALLAGGQWAFVEAVEGAEDDMSTAATDVDGLEVGPDDTVVGIAASGRTPYVIGGLRRARERGAQTVALACNRGSLIGKEAEVAIEVATGPEVLTGSTRLKAGTAQKMVCNMLSTAAMVRIGKTYGNFMVDMRPTNAKLVDRARRIVAAATESDEQTAADALTAAGGRTKVAVVMLLAGVDATRAEQLLEKGSGSVSAAITP
ncbi:N-acetylmuramic acid 6-phosphate etherase [Flexivirga endophytica]|uniref:N-acetylmuramic acid 6-phosphate etherase n=1 Tax=Flexivirga endophytica TaxID=1849103 RepID=A0A916T552_9MICO|nr:N-acetylmuramic acid 6-phosphate etherase [Flexivirga endophytica]GGB31996.1 N-acetylmuramic acid 6-phosphate etherase [Flexivirga endophytica]GHB52964.1 N-acetylmuramic acid 6-phosphate etherase [Flexivirga endophytica]